MKRTAAQVGRFARRSLVLAVVALVLVPTVARAQTLNLDAPKPPAPGEGKAALALAREAEDDIRRLEAEPSSPAERAAPARAFRIAVRRLIASLLRTGEGAGETGSPHIVTAHRLWDDVDELDALAALSTDAKTLPTTASMLTGAMQAFVDAVDPPPPGGTEADAGKALPAVPTGLAELDRSLRDATAMLALHAPGAQSGWLDHRDRVGWVAPMLAAAPVVKEAEAGDQLTQLADRLAAAGLSAPTVQAVQELAPFVREAEQHFAFFRQAIDVRESLLSASKCVVFGDGSPPPSWIAPGAIERLTKSLDDATFAACRRDSRTGAREGLDRLTRAAAMIDATQALVAPSGKVGNEAALRKARQAVSDTLAMLAEPSGSEPVIRGVERGLALLSARRGLSGEAALPRELKPAWRVLDDTAAGTESALLDAIPRITAAARSDGGGSGGGRSPMADPALVALLAAHQKAIDDLRAILRIGEFIREAEGEAAAPPGRAGKAERRLVADRLLKLAQEVARSQPTLQGRAPALEALSQFASSIDLLRSFVGEEQLRAIVAAASGGAAGAGGGDSSALDSSWNTLTGNKAAELISAIDSHRSAYLGAWAREELPSGKPPASALPRRGAKPAADQPTAESPARHIGVLQVIRALMAAIVDVQTVRELAQPAPPTQAAEGLRAWPGAFFPELGMNMLTQGVEEPLAAIAALANDPAQSERAMRLLSSFRSERTTMRLFARLDREARSLNILDAPAFVHTASPPSPRSWMSTHRAPIASVCRTLDELAVATRDRDRRRVRELESYLASISERLLESLGNE